MISIYTLFFFSKSLTTRKLRIKSFEVNVYSKGCIVHSNVAHKVCYIHYLFVLHSLDLLYFIPNVTVLDV